jgi:spore protease
MNHEIDFNNFEIRTDLALEQIEKTKYLNGINQTEVNKNGIKIHEVKLSKQNSLNKKKGTYITILFDDVTDFQNSNYVEEIFELELEKIIHNLKITTDDLVLVIGLGNHLSTPDALGPKTINQLVVTNHLYSISQKSDGFGRVAIIEPGVTGSTGIETIDTIKGVVDKINPKLIITIDSLASSSIEHVNKTIQITDTGIQPGSGIGNQRKEISYDTLGIPVIAIGVPTVVDANIIVADTIGYMYKHYAFNKKIMNNPINRLIPTNANYLKSKIDASNQDKENFLGLVGSLSDVEIKQLIKEVLTPIGYNFMVTPKEIDFVIDKLANILSNGINKTFHPILKSIDKNNKAC